MKSFSLLTLLLLLVIAALSVSQFSISRRLQNAIAEIDTIRRNYGYIRVTDEDKVYVSSIEQHRGSSSDSLRFHIPLGQRYFLHLSETSAEPVDIPPVEEPLETICLNNWAGGADEIISYGIYLDPATQSPYLHVSSRNSHFFTYKPDDWPAGIALSVKSRLATNPQAEFTKDDVIVLLFANTPSLDRGVLLWLEPESHQKQSLAEKLQQKK